MEELVVALAGDFLDEDAEDYVVGVAVAPLVAGRPFNRQGVDLLHKLVFSKVEAEIKRTIRSYAVVGLVLREARGVGEKIFDEDGFQGSRSVGEIFRDSVVGGELVLFNEHHDGGDELLANRAGLHEGVRRDVGGKASWIAPSLALGAHTASASYSGDASFQASAATAQTFSVGLGTPYITVSPTQNLYNTIHACSSLTVGVVVGTIYRPMFANTGPAPPGTLAPIGTVTVKLVWDNSDVFGLGCGADTTGLSQTATLVAPSGLFSQYSSVEAVFSNIPARSNGYGYMLCAQYNGDANWEPYGAVYLNDINVAAPATRWRLEQHC